MNPLVSVVVPTWNGAAFVEETIESVLAQDYAPLELCVCDDGSTDGTVALLERFGGRITLVRQENRGVAAARNRAAAAARGDVLAFLDHDDVWESSMLSTLVPRLCERDQIGLAYADSLVIDARGNVRGRRGSYLRYAEGRVFQALLRGNFIPVETTLVRASLWRELGGFDERLRYVEDYELCLRVARRAEIAFHPEPLARYRIHERNLSHDLEPMLCEWLEVLGRLEGLDERERGVVDGEEGRLCADLAWRALRRGDLDACGAWIASANGRGPASRRWRASVARSLLSPLPLRVRRALLARLPRRKLYGVDASVPATRDAR